MKVYLWKFNATKVRNCRHIATTIYNEVLNLEMRQRSAEIITF